MILRILVACLLLGVSIPCMAASPDNAVQLDGKYTVQPDDTLWELAGTHRSDHETWREVYELNPFLKEQGRRFKKQDGTIVVIVKPGEQLVGLQKFGIMPDPIPYEKLVLSEQPTKALKTAKSAPENMDTTWDAIDVVQACILAFGIPLVLLLLGMAIRAHVRRRRQKRQREIELNQDPVTSRPPMVPGGIPATETKRLNEYFDQRAIDAFQRRYPGSEQDRNAIRVERISPIQSGRVHGEGSVGYADTARPRRIPEPIPAYRARFRLPDGTEEEIVCLQACMNPVFWGEGLRGFHFIPDGNPDVVPAPEPPTPGPQVVPHPAVVARATRVAADEAGHSTLTIGDQVMVINGAVHLKVDDEAGAVFIEHGELKITVKPKRKARQKRSAADRKAAS